MNLKTIQDAFPTS